MSVDDRLREAFGASAEPMWEPDQAAALRAVTVRRRRELAVQRSVTVLGLAAAAALVAVLVSGPGDPEGTRDINPSVTPTGDASTAEPLEGVWRTELISARDVRVALATSGHADRADRLLSQVPNPFRLVWTVDGTVTQMRVVGRDEKFIVDDEIITVTGDQLVLSPRYDVGESVHQIVTDDGLLRLDFVSTTEASTGGVPGDVWQRVLYDTFDFTRQ